MNENIDLTKILEGCEGVELWSPLIGRCTLERIDTGSNTPIRVRRLLNDYTLTFTEEGYYYYSSKRDDSECILFPAKDQRDWGKFVKPEIYPNTIEDSIELMKYLSCELAKIDELLLYRNAWWKVDNWMPNWTQTDVKYCLKVVGDDICKTVTMHEHNLLAFKSEEIRDKFLETFRSLIEECKEFI